MYMNFILEKFLTIFLPLAEIIAEDKILLDSFLAWLGIQQKTLKFPGELLA